MQEKEQEKEECPIKESCCSFLSQAGIGKGRESNPIYTTKV